MVPEGIPVRKNLAVNTIVRSAIGSGRHTMKKGPWTASEDAVLTDYVKRHGEGNWNAVQRNSGLLRCGKSCRLRWANHLRPNLKKGAFSGEEENLIVQLHAKYGNKWARMASQLPGRTDNEIKNYWNTRLKRRQRAGLPIYPQEIRPNQNLADFPMPNMIPSSASLEALVSPPPPPPPAGRLQKSDFSAPMSIYDMYNSPAAPPPPRNNFPASSSSYLSRHGLALSLSPSVNSSSTPFSPPSSGSFAFSSNPAMSQMPYNSLNLGITQYSNNSRPSFQGLPASIQSALGQNNRRYNPTASSGSNYNTVIQTSSSGGDDVDNQDEALEGFSQSNHRSNTGLLEDLFGESLARAKKPAVHQDTVPKIEAEEDNANEKFLWDYKLMEDIDSPSHRLKRVKVSPEEGGLEDEDLVSSLLDNSPLTVQMPELYDEYGAVSDGEWPESARVEKEEQHEYSNPPVAAADDASTWKNLPEIY